ncbi:MAG: hypothetical protein QW412_00845 [Candidatus Aenigmatarchaeota archaeon]
MSIFDFLAQESLHNIFYNFFLPFIVMFAILFGALEGIRIFNKKINLVLSLAITITAFYGGGFSFFLQYFLLLGPYTAFVAFVLLFFVGILIWAFGRGKEIYYKTAAPHKKLEKINKEIEKLYEKYRRETNPAKKRAIDKQIFDLERIREHLKREVQSRYT